MPAPERTLRISPVTSSTSGRYWAGVAEGELWMQRCPDTGRLVFPPSPSNPFGRRQTVWTRLSGCGRIWSFVVPHPPLMAQFDAAAPYVSALVAIDEDPMARLAGLLVAAPGAPIGSVDAADVWIGQAVVIDFRPLVDGVVEAPRWIPAEQDRSV